MMHEGSTYLRYSVNVAISSFFNSAMLLKEVNSTTITLIPKVPNPSYISDYRPIACCNVIYKCIKDTY